MRLSVGDTCILSSGAILWRKYPTDVAAAGGASYDHLAAGAALMVVGEQSWAGRFFSYVLDCAGNTFVTPSDYLSLRTRVMR